MRYIFIITISLLLASCGPSSEEKKNIAAVTCSIMGETRNMDAAVRVREMNNAREKIGGEPFLQGDDAIKEAFEYGLCEELVLGTYDEVLNSMREEARLAWEAGAEDRKIADSKPSIKETFHLNGKLQSRTNYQSINDGGKRHGLSETYHENGQLKTKENYKDGKEDGLSEDYYENGQLQYKVNYKDGEWHGLAETYDENGQLKRKVNWKDDKLDGLWETYDEDGSLILDMCHKNGKVTDDSYCKPQ